MISLTMIVRDDEPTLKDCLESLRPHVDEIVIVDTGSVDNSPKIAKEYADVFETFLECNDEDGRIEDFAMARNRSLELASCEWITWADGDDIVQGAERLPKYAERNDYDNIIYLMPYEYSYDPAGNVTCLHSRERLVRPGRRFAWQSPVHEVLCPIGPVEGTIVTFPITDIVFKHRKHLSKKAPDADRNLRILKKHLKRVGEGDTRALYYLGIEYGVQGDAGSALRCLERYVQLSGWTDEKCLALLDIAKIYQGLGIHNQAIDWALRAMCTKSWSEPYWVLMRSFYALAMQDVEPDYNFRKAAHFGQIGLSLKAADTVLFVNPMDRKTVHLWLNVALGRIGDVRGAIESCEAGLAELPGNMDLANNLEKHTKELAKRVIVSSLDAAGVSAQSKALIESIVKDGEAGAAPAAVAALPEPAAQTAKDDGKLDVVFFIGPAWENWNPETLMAGGMGGSETMAWELARRLRKQGHRVRMYSQCLPTQEGIFEGVEYWDASRYRNLTCDVLIASRRPEAVDDMWNIKAKARVLWIHDVHCGESLNSGRELRFDRIFALSNWHKGNLLKSYPTMDPDKITVTRNGIDLDAWKAATAAAPQRNPHRAIYSSSPDRGLQTLLDIWPRVREQVSDAELHVFYGFENWEKAVKERGDFAEGGTIRMLKHLIKTTPGIVFHGRVSPGRLIEEMLASNVWSYPTWFHETFCISAVQAQAANLHIICTPTAALVETVGKAGAMVEGDWRSEELKAGFVELIVSAMQSGQAPVHDVERFSLDTLAVEWSDILTELVSKTERDVVPRFHVAEQFKPRAGASLPPKIVEETKAQGEVGAAR